MLTLLLFAKLTLAFNLQPVEASGTIYIRADGSVDPPEVAISSVDNVTYTFAADIHESVVVERDNLVIDGAGYTVQGTAAHNSVGIKLSHRNNVTIKNVRVTAFWYGVYLHNSLNNTISGTVVTDVDEVGINLYSCFGNHIVENIVTNNGVGIMLSYSLENNVSGNEAKNNLYGIGAWESSNYNTIHDNYVIDNLCGVSLGHSSNGNSIFGNILFDNLRGMELCKCVNNNVFRNNLTLNDGIGVYLYNSLNNILYQNIVSKNLYGFKVSNSFNHSIYNNNIIDNTYQVVVEKSENKWDDGYLVGGNYWSDHTCAGNPSDGSQPYVSDADNIDHYPFQHPDGWLIPEMPSDVNSDGIVDISDVVIVALAFGSTVAEPNNSGYPYDPRTDLNQDGIINIIDLVTVGVNFGKTW